MKQCPNCSEWLKEEAILCTHCGHQFEPVPAVAASGFTPTPNSRKVGCAILILAALALMLWGFSGLYQSESPAAANAIQGEAAQ